MTGFEVTGIKVQDSTQGVGGLFLIIIIIVAVFESVLLFMEFNNLNLARIILGHVATVRKMNHVSQLDNYSSA